MRKNSTPYHQKNQGSAKRTLPSLSENKPVRKKIIFENLSCPLMENDGDFEGRSARPGPFEASAIPLGMVSGVLPLLSQDLIFTVGATDENPTAKEGDMEVQGADNQTAGSTFTNSAPEGQMQPAPSQEEEEECVMLPASEGESRPEPSSMVTCETQQLEGNKMEEGSELQGMVKEVRIDSPAPELAGREVPDEVTPEEIGSTIVCKSTQGMGAVGGDPTRLTHSHQNGIKPIPLFCNSNGTNTYGVSASTCLSPSESQDKIIGTSACMVPKEMESNLLLKKHSFTPPTMEVSSSVSNLFSPPLSDDEKNYNSNFPAFTERRLSGCNEKLTGFELERDETELNLPPSIPTENAWNNAGKLQHTLFKQRAAEETVEEERCNEVTSRNSLPR